MRKNRIVILSGVVGSAVFVLGLPVVAPAQSAAQTQMQEEMNRMRQDQQQNSQALRERVEKEITAKSPTVADSGEKTLERKKPESERPAARVPDSQTSAEAKPKVKKSGMKSSGQNEFEKRKEYYKQQHESNLIFLKKKLSGNTQLSDEQKVDLINYFENLYGQNISFRADKRQGAVAFFEKIVNDDKLTIGQKKDELKKFCDQEKEKTKKEGASRNKNL